MKTAEDFFTQKNGGKTAEELLSEGVLISPILAVRLMEEYHEARMKEELIDLVRLARKGSHVSFGNQTHWEFDIDRDRQVVDNYLTTRKNK